MFPTLGNMLVMDITSIGDGIIERTCAETGFSVYEPFIGGAQGDPMGPLHVTPSLRHLLPHPKHGQALADAIGRTVIYWGRHAPHDDLTFIPRRYPRPDQASSYATVDALMKHFAAISRLLSCLQQ